MARDSAVIPCALISTPDVSLLGPLLTLCFVRRCGVGENEGEDSQCSQQASGTFAW